jgi:hypothetical protein
MVYVAQDPSGLGCGERSGRVPGEQQTYSPTVRLVGPQAAAEGL